MTKKKVLVCGGDLQRLEADEDFDESFADGSDEEFDCLQEGK